MSKSVKIIHYFDAAETVILSLLAFFLCFKPKVATILIAVYALFALTSGVVRGVNRLAKPFYPFLILFVCYCIGLIFTSNFDYGLKDIETRLSFVILPLCVGLTKRQSALQLSWIIWAFTIGALIDLSGGLYQAYQCFDEEGRRNCFENYRLSIDMHPTYLALYILAGAVFILVDAFQRKKWILLKLLAVAIACFYIYFAYQLYSLGPWIAFAVMLAVTGAAIAYFNNKLGWFLGGSFAAVVVGIFLMLNLDLLRADYDTIQQELEVYFENPTAYLEKNQDNTSSVAARILIWNASSQFVAKHPFGVGTGDIKDELMDFYRTKGMHVYADKKLNPHCQYLQTAGAIGILPALFFLATFVYYIRIGFKQKNLYLISLSALFATACLFESVLERQWGIVFFLFFLCVFLADNPKKQASNT